MDLIVAVYDDWGIGREGTQPVALSADRKYFRQQTAGAAVIVGRRTLGDFPGGRPLPKRVETVHSVEEALERAKAFDRTFVIGGARVYGQLLPYCQRAYVTKVHVTPESDVFFPNLDENPAWKLVSQTEPETEESFSYQFCVYERV